MKPNFNGCTLESLETECPYCGDHKTNGGNPIFLNEVIEVSDLDGVNVVVGDIICISCGDDHSGAFFTQSNDCPTCKDTDPEGRGARHTGSSCPDCEK